MLIYFIFKQHKILWQTINFEHFARAIDYLFQYGKFHQKFHSLDPPNILGYYSFL